MLLSTASGSLYTPLWPYVVGGIAAILTTLFGGWRLYKSWRADIESEAEKKVINTRALQENTAASARNSAAIAELTTRFDMWDRFTKRTEERLDGHDRRLNEHDGRLDDYHGRLDDYLRRISEIDTRTRQPQQRPPSSGGH